MSFGSHSHPQQLDLPAFLHNAKIVKTEMQNGHVAFTLDPGRGRIVFSGNFQINVEAGVAGLRPNVIDVESRIL